MNMDARAVISDVVYTQDVDGELIMLDMKSEKYFGLNCVGSDIWKLLEEGRTLRETVATMLEMYDVEPGVIRADVEALVKRLVNDAIIRLE